MTNDSATTPRDLQQNLSQHGIHIPEHHFYTSGQATAEFLYSQMPEVIISTSFFLFFFCASGERGIIMNNFIFTSLFYIIIGRIMLCRW